MLKLSVVSNIFLFFIGSDECFIADLSKVDCPSLIHLDYKHILKEAQNSSF